MYKWFLGCLMPVVASTYADDFNSPPLEALQPFSEEAARPYKALSGYLRRRNITISSEVVEYWQNQAGVYWFCMKKAEGAATDCYRLLDKKGSWIISEHEIKR